jgi:heat shock protein HslJ
VPHLVVVWLARPVLLVAIAIAIGGCSDVVSPSASAPPGAISTLDGTSWIVVSVNGHSPIAGAVPTLAFDAGQINGFFGCNHGGGRYRLDIVTGQFAVQDLAETAMGCLQPGVMEFESGLVQVLGGATQATLDPTGKLVLSGPGGRIILVTLEHPALGS